MVVRGPAGEEHRDHGQRGDGDDIDEPDVDVEVGHVLGPWHRAPAEHRRNEDQHGRQVEEEAVRPERYQRLLLHELERVGERLQEAEGADPVRTLADLELREQPPLHPAADQQYTAHEREDAEPAQQRRHPVGEPRPGAEVIEFEAQPVHSEAQVADVVPLTVEPAVEDQEADRPIGRQEAQAKDRSDELDDRRQAHRPLEQRAVLEDLLRHRGGGAVRVERRVGAFAHRSISPTTMSIEPSVTTASGSAAPTASSRNSERLINDGARMWKRYGAGEPSETR